MLKSVHVVARRLFSTNRISTAANATSTSTLENSSSLKTGQVGKNDAFVTSTSSPRISVDEVVKSLQTLCQSDKFEANVLENIKATAYDVTRLKGDISSFQMARILKAFSKVPNRYQQGWILNTLVDIEPEFNAKVQEMDQIGITSCMIAISKMNIEPSLQNEYLKVLCARVPELVDGMSGVSVAWCLNALSKSNGVFYENSVANQTMKLLCESRLKKVVCEMDIIEVVTCLTALGKLGEAQMKWHGDSVKIVVDRMNCISDKLTLRDVVGCLNALSKTSIADEIVIDAMKNLSAMAISRVNEMTPKNLVRCMSSLSKVENNNDEWVMKAIQTLFAHFSSLDKGSCDSTSLSICISALSRISSSASSPEPWVIDGMKSLIIDEHVKKMNGSSLAFSLNALSRMIHLGAAETATAAAAVAAGEAETSTSISDDHGWVFDGMKAILGRFSSIDDEFLITPAVLSMSMSALVKFDTSQAWVIDGMKCLASFIKNRDDRMIWTTNPIAISNTIGFLSKMNVTETWVLQALHVVASKIEFVSGAINPQSISNSIVALTKVVQVHGSEQPWAIEIMISLVERLKAIENDTKMHPAAVAVTMNSLSKIANYEWAREGVKALVVSGRVRNIIETGKQDYFVNFWGMSVSEMILTALEPFVSAQEDWALTAKNDLK